jgi:hypothetical protein
VPDTYPSAKLQAKLLGHFGDRITIQPQRGQGMSNIMRCFYSFSPVSTSVNNSLRIHYDMINSTFNKTITFKDFHH